MSNGNLVLTRRSGESFHIGEDITITICTIQGRQAKIAINAPKDIKILRDELFQRDQRVAV